MSKKGITLAFDVDQSFLVGINRLKDLLNIEICDCGLKVSAVKGDKVGVTVKDGAATIYFVEKHQFFRELGVLVQNLRKSSADVSFEIVEDDYFKTVGTMVDTSRQAAPTVESFCKLADYLALMGYNMMMIYIEDMIKLENRPYFGHLRGRYTTDEIKAIDDYCYEYGIEVVPCIECYGHMERYLFWWDAHEVKDTASVLLAREEKTFELVEDIISTVSSCVRSKKIHIGMDEAWDMGRGQFLTKNGYVPPFQIFNEYMDRLMQITDKYGLEAMMWSDMYFRICDKGEEQLYYEKDTVVTPEVAEKIPKNVKLVYWHYGEEPYCDDYMLKKHIDLNREVMYAGGFWDWVGHFPEHDYAMETNKFALQACRNNGVREAMATIWCNDNAECNLFARLFNLSFFAETCYNNDVTNEQLRERFEAVTGGDYNAFYAMRLYHNTKNENDDYSDNYTKRFLGKPFFWQDIMEGLFDTHLLEKPISAHYYSCVEKMKAYKGGKWDYLYSFAREVFEYLAIKTEIAENLLPAYQKGDKATLKRIAKVLLPKLKKITKVVHKSHKKNWFNTYKIAGWSNLDTRYGGVESRCDTSKEIIEDYLSGKTKFIASLDEGRLPKGLSGFISYKVIRF